MWKFEFFSPFSYQFFSYPGFSGARKYKFTSKFFCWNISFCNPYIAVTPKRAVITDLSWCWKLFLSITTQWKLRSHTFTWGKQFQIKTSGLFPIVRILINWNLQKNYYYHIPFPKFITASCLQRKSRPTVILINSFLRSPRNQ